MSFARFTALLTAILVLTLLVVAAYGAGSTYSTKGLVVGSTGWSGVGTKMYASVPLAAAAGATTSYTGAFVANRSMTITAARISFVAYPASTLSNVTFALTNYDLSATTDDNLLSTATIDLDAGVAKTSTTLTLTATTADRTLAAGDYVYATIVGGNADASAGTGGVLTIEYYLN